MILPGTFGRIDRPGPTVIEVPVGEMPSPWHLLYQGRARPRAPG